MSARWPAADGDRLRELMQRNICRSLMRGCTPAGGCGRCPQARACAEETENSLEFIASLRILARRGQ